jgi:FMN phosphatase YigB (HAD superfamily)
VSGVRCRAIALGYGGRDQHRSRGSRDSPEGRDPATADALHELARLGLRLLLATNATAAGTRWSALQIVGVHELFAVGLVSYSLNVRKDEPLFYDLVVTAARCPAPEVLFVGDSIANDVVGPMRAGMQACLVRPGGLRPGERVLDRALLIGHICELPALVEVAR